MQSAVELKRIFQDGWNLPERIANYVRNVREFEEEEPIEAWRASLEPALNATGRLRVLDVGTGPGVFACLYAEMGHECVGLDFSNTMLAEARRRATERKADCTFVFGDAEEPPFDAESFDAVSSRHVLFNLPRPGVAVRHWVRLLKPGGRLIVIGDEHLDQSDAISSRLRGAMRRHVPKRPGGPRPGWNPSPDYLKAVSQCPLFRHSSGAIRAVMEAAGLEDIRLSPTEAIQAFRQQHRDHRHGQNGGIYVLAGTKPSIDREDSGPRPA